MKSRLQDFTRRFSAKTWAALALGILIGVFFHYIFYRLSLPSKPFIYVAF
jgi:uncharacterized membrane-anchored protein YhcB (DUF1043 family)